MDKFLSNLSIFLIVKILCYIYDSWNLRIINIVFINISLEERLDLVEIFVRDESLRQMLRQELMKRMPDFYRMAKKFQRHKATLQVSIISVNILNFLLLGVGSCIRWLNINLCTKHSNRAVTLKIIVRTLIEQSYDFKISKVCWILF